MCPISLEKRLTRIDTDQGRSIRDSHPATYALSAFIRFDPRPKALVPMNQAIPIRQFLTTLFAAGVSDIP
jgi:hypothetical protein